MFKYYLFEDHDSGERFVVNERSIEQAYATAENWFTSFSYLCELDEYEVDTIGYDVF